MVRNIVTKYEWFKKFKERYPSFKMTHCFYGKDNIYDSLTVSGVIDGEQYDKDGVREEEYTYYVRNPKTKRPEQRKGIRKINYKKYDIVPNTGYVVDFFIRLKPGQDEHVDYFKLWKEIFIAKFKMGREKDFIDFKVFFPFIKSQNSFRFNYRGWRHINSESSPQYALEDTYADEQKQLSLRGEQEIDKEEDPFTC